MLHSNASFGSGMLHFQFTYAKNYTIIIFYSILSMSLIILIHKSSFQRVSRY